jgi:hypothetical protein
MTTPQAPYSDTMQGLMLSRARWRTVALVAVGVGAGFVLGGMQQVSSRKIQAIALDPSQNSGRSSSTLIAVDETGKLFALDTSKPKSTWEPYKFSP